MQRVKATLSRAIIEFAILCCSLLVVFQLRSQMYGFCNASTACTDEPSLRLVLYCSHLMTIGALEVLLGAVQPQIIIFLTHIFVADRNTITDVQKARPFELFNFLAPSFF